MVLVTSGQFDLRQIAESGQCFRMTELDDRRFRIIANGHMLHLEQTGNGVLLDCTLAEYQQVWYDYFDLDTDYGEFLHAVPQSDEFLSAAARLGSGIRILRQDTWETLISFIISQRKNIPAIRRCVETICTRWGEPLGETLYAFPTPERLAACTEDELAACSLGYRTRYVAAAARLVADGTLDLDGAAALPDDELYARLLTVPGVGAKVADCTMLFGFHRLDRFPRDVWINRVVAEKYNGEFPFSLYDGFAGVVQQYLFCYARSMGV